MLLITLLLSLLLHSKYCSQEISQGAISLSFISLVGFLYAHIECNVPAWLLQFVFWFVISYEGFRLLLRFQKIDFLWFWGELLPWWFRIWIISKISQAFLLKSNRILRHILLKWSLGKCVFVCKLTVFHVFWKFSL